ncbi:STAM-binding protein-like [Coccinella septempunctata]|uniref:STAM-binding protein-like n=1 Tax=Coccinella septempunctata TaxID=41139 RepID=UPI001D09814B|nr:STAM-binding protein-like [Coccinella septempunctata]
MTPGPQDLSETSLNRADLRPKKRLDTLIERSKTTHIDHQIPIRRYIQIADALLHAAKHSQMKKSHESSLMNYLRYQSLVKKLRTHKKYGKIPIGERSAFDYKLKNVMKNVKVLSEVVFSEYKKFYQMSKFDNQDQNLEGYQEQRPTISTVHTFISANRGELEEAKWSQPSLTTRSSVASRSRSRAVTDSGSCISFPTYRTFSSNVDVNYGLRRSIFPTKQVREFDVIYSQRRIVRSHRTVIVPSRITTEFSYLSYRNTQKNVETVAYLAGRELNATQLLVSHLILPEQVGYSDYFKVKDSIELIRYLDEHDLLTIGWIHSHPVESSYLSSSDMHYHSVFQSVLPEAIAMVYSPKYMNSTTFNLTPNHGLKFILNCRKKGFHTHPTNPPLTMISQHAITDLYGDLTVKDFRDSKKVYEDWDGVRASFTSNLFERMMKDTNSGEKGRIRKSEVTFVHIGR